MTSQVSRTALFQRLAEVLGPDHASTLMTYLPQDEPVTKADIRALEARLVQRFERIDQRFGGIDQHFESIDHRFESIDHRFESIDQRFESINQRFESIDQRFESIDQRLDRIETRLNNHELRFDSIHEALRQQTRTYMFATIGAMISLSGMAFGAAALI